MNGIDISKWQAGIDLSKVPCDFVIIKASGGLGYPNFDFDRQIKQAMSLGKLVGVYHFARDGYTGTTPEQEAEVFLKKVKPFIGKAILVLDWEADAVKLGAGWAKRWLDHVRKETGVTPLLYSYWAEAKQRKWAEVAKTNPLWVAQYASGYTPVRGYLSDPPGEKDVGCWGENIAIRQYTSQGYLPGYGGNLDLNLAYIGKAEWDKLCGKTGTETPEEKPAEPDKVGDLARKIATEINDSGLNAEEVLAKVSALLGKKPAETPAEPEKKLTAEEIDKIALEVLNGKWGNGVTRRRRLTAAGYDYQTIQNRVNEIDAERRKK